MEDLMRAARRPYRREKQPRRVILLRLLCVFAGCSLAVLLLRSPSLGAFLESQEEPLVPSQVLDVPFIDQRDKYPTGCESVTAVMALRWAGVDISVEEFIDDYLPQGEAPHYDETGNYVGADPWEKFLGSPYSEEGWGCYAPVIAQAVEQVLEDRGITRLETRLLQDVELSTLLEEYVEKEIPVMVWATIDMETPVDSTEFFLEDTGELFTWIYPLHCLLLTGADEEHYFFNDPLVGKNTAYEKNQVEIAYRGVGMQAVAVVPVKE